MWTSHGQELTSGASQWGLSGKFAYPTVISTDMWVGTHSVANAHLKMHHRWGICDEASTAWEGVVTNGATI